MPKATLIPKPTSTPKDFFLHLLGTITLFVSIVSFIALLFQYVNTLYPDQLTYNSTQIFNTIRWSTSALVVMFPVYLLVAWLIHRDIALEPAKRELRVRKWLIHFTLFIAAITLIIDFITLIYNYLGGDLTLSFALKILVVFVTAGLVFWYYLSDLRERQTTSRKIWAWLSTVIVLAAIIAGFFIIGSPASQRARKFDEQRVSDLNQIQSLIVDYWMRKNNLPTQLADLNNDIQGTSVPVDPQTNQAYEYHHSEIAGPLSFQLCATFNAKSTNELNSYLRPPAMPYYAGIPNQNWTHGVGHQCFDRTIDPSLFKTPTPVKPSL